MATPWSHDLPRIPAHTPWEILRNLTLFVITFLTTSISGMMWLGEFDLVHISRGFPFSVSILFILACHEFAHYFACRRHGVASSLPWFIPIPPIAELVHFGTMGAVIKTRTPIPSRRALFDIGISGPIAGFIASIIILAWGFSHLPGPEFLLSIHPDYDFSLGSSPGIPPGYTVTFGSNLMYEALAYLFAPAGAYVPPMSEMYHYPFLITGWFGLFVTALNLIPAGQLDGGHVTYATLGRVHGRIARVMVVILAVVGVTAFVPILLDLAGFASAAALAMSLFDPYGAWFWPGWLVWAILILVFIKVDHPPVLDQTPIGRGRRLLSLFALFMFIVSMSPAPIYVK